MFWRALSLPYCSTTQEELSFGETVGILAAWLWVLPWMYRIDTFTVSLTNAYLAALGLAALLMVVPKTLDRNLAWFVLGVSSGLLLLLQPSLLPVVLVYGAWLACFKARSRRVLIAIAGLVLAMAPWTVRNYLTFGRFIPFRDNFGLELWLGNHPGMRGTVDFATDFPGLDPTSTHALANCSSWMKNFKLHGISSFAIPPLSPNAYSAGWWSSGMSHILFPGFSSRSLGGWVRP